MYGILQPTSMLSKWCNGSNLLLLVHFHFVCKLLLDLFDLTPRSSASFILLIQIIFELFNLLPHQAFLNEHGKAGGMITRQLTTNQFWGAGRHSLCAVQVLKHLHAFDSHQAEAVVQLPVSGRQCPWCCQGRYTLDFHQVCCSNHMFSNATCVTGAWWSMRLQCLNTIYKWRPPKSFLHKRLYLQCFARILASRLREPFLGRTIFIKISLNFKKSENDQQPITPFVSVARVHHFHDSAGNVATSKKKCSRLIVWGKNRPFSDW